MCQQLSRGLSLLSSSDDYGPIITTSTNNVVKQLFNTTSATGKALASPSLKSSFSLNNVCKYVLKFSVMLFSTENFQKLMKNYWHSLPQLGTVLFVCRISITYTMNYSNCVSFVVTNSSSVDDMNVHNGPSLTSNNNNKDDNGILKHIKWQEISPVLSGNQRLTPILNRSCNLSPVLPRTRASTSVVMSTPASTNSISGAFGVSVTTSPAFSTASTSSTGSIATPAHNRSPIPNPVTPLSISPNPSTSCPSVSPDLSGASDANTSSSTSQSIQSVTSVSVSTLTYLKYRNRKWMNVRLTTRMRPVTGSSSPTIDESAEARAMAWKPDGFCPSSVWSTSAASTTSSSLARACTFPRIFCDESSNVPRWSSRSIRRRMGRDRRSKSPAVVDDESLHYAERDASLSGAIVAAGVCEKHRGLLSHQHIVTKAKSIALRAPTRQKVLPCRSIESRELGKS